MTEQHSLQDWADKLKSLCKEIEAKGYTVFTDFDGTIRVISTDRSTDCFVPGIAVRPEGSDE